MNTMMDCRSCRRNLPDLLLEPQFAAKHPGLKAHMTECAECRNELAELQATFALLDGWEAPEPSPYFDSRLYARLREAQAEAPEGFWARVRSWVQLSSGRSFRPALAGSLGLVLIAAGGGTFATLHNRNAAVAQPSASATVNDLKILDNNAQAIQQMNALLDTSDDDTEAATPTG